MAPRVTGLRLGRAIPNPFGAGTRIGFHLPAAGSVVVTIYDARGAEIRRLAEGIFSPGDYLLFWDEKSRWRQRPERCLLL